MPTLLKAVLVTKEALTRAAVALNIVTTSEARGDRVTVWAETKATLIAPDIITLANSLIVQDITKEVEWLKITVKAATRALGAKVRKKAKARDQGNRAKKLMTTTDTAMTQMVTMKVILEKAEAYLDNLRGQGEH